MSHESWTTLVGFISMGVSMVCAFGSLAIGAYCVRRAFRDQREAQQNRSER